MNEAAEALLNLTGDWTWIGFVVFLRIGAAMALLPAFGEHTVSIRIKLAVSLAFTAIIAPAVAPILDLPPADLRSLLTFSLSETVCGLAFGASIRMFVWMLQVAGTIAGQSTSLAQLLGAAGVDPQPAIAQFLVISALALAAMAGLHVRVAEALIQSYQAMPAGHFPLSHDLSAWGLANVAHMFANAFTLAAPFVITSLIYNVALGAINRAMPQLMVAFVGAPAITAGGLILLMLVSPLILSLWLDGLNMRLADPFAMPK